MKYTNEDVLSENNDHISNTRQYQQLCKNRYYTKNIETDDKKVITSNQTLDQVQISSKTKPNYIPRSIRLTSTRISCIDKNDKNNQSIENCITNTTQAIIILSKNDNDFYNADSERSSKKSSHNEYVDDTISSDSEFYHQHILPQSKNSKTNQYNRKYVNKSNSSHSDTGSISSRLN